MRRLLLAPLLLVACATNSPKPTGDELVLSIRNLGCSDCAGALEARAKKQPGVHEAKFDAKTVELHVWADPGTSPEAVARVVADGPLDGEPIEVRIGAGQGAYSPFLPLDPKWDAKQLSARGEDVADLQPSLGKVTVVDFYADWCGPCHELDKHLHERLAQDPGLAYRRLNVVDWDSPLARHYLGSATELPYVLVLDGQGREVARLAGFKPEALDEALLKARGQPAK